MQINFENKHGCREYNIPPCVAFVEYDKAFDSVQTQTILTSLQEQGIEGVYVEILKDVWLKSTKSGPVGFEKIDFSHFSPCSMQWMFQTPGVSIVHVQKTVSYNTL